MPNGAGKTTTSTITPVLRVGREVSCYENKATEDSSGADTTVLPEPEYNARNDLPPLQKSLCAPRMKCLCYRKIHCCVAEHQLEHQEAVCVASGLKSGPLCCTASVKLLSVVRLVVFLLPAVKLNGGCKIPMRPDTKVALNVETLRHMLLRPKVLKELNNMEALHRIYLCVHFTKLNQLVK